MEKLAHVTSSGALTGLTTTRRVAPRTSPHLSAVAEADACCIIAHDKASSGFAASSNEKTRTVQAPMKDSTAQ